MTEPKLAETLLAELASMPPQLQAAAQWMLDHPDDVALLSMREQARRAGVTPATMTRVAQRLGFEGYEAVRLLSAASVRARPDTFRGRAEELVARRDLEGDEALVADMLAAQGTHLHRLAEPGHLERIVKAADRLANARTIFCLGRRSAFPVVFIFHYVRALIGPGCVLVDGAGDTGIDQLRGAGADDVLLAISVNPYTRRTVEAVEFAAKRGVPIVAITDSPASPLAQLASETVLIGTETPSFFHTMTPAFAAAECLLGLIAAKKGKDALQAIAANERDLEALDTFVRPLKPRSPLP